MLIFSNKYAEERLRTAVNLWRVAKSKYESDHNLYLLWTRQKEALKELGIGLHPLQDVFAHGDFVPFTGNGWKHDDIFDNVYYDWGANKTSLGPKLSSPGRRYMMTAFSSCIYLITFRQNVGLSLP